MDISIEEYFEKVKKWSAENDCIFIEADVKNRMTEITIDSIEENSIDTYLNIITKAKVKVIVYEHIICDFNTISNISDVIHNLNGDDYEKSEIEEFSSNLKILKNYEGKILDLNLYSLCDNISYNINYDIIDIFNIYDELLTLVSDYEKSIDPNIVKPLQQFTAKQLKELAHEYAQSEEYIKLTTKEQRAYYANEYFEPIFLKMREENKLIPPYGCIRDILIEAAMFFEKKIKPKIEKELKEKIKELEKLGWTKIKICQELAVSKSVVDKYI